MQLTNFTIEFHSDWRNLNLISKNNNSKMRTLTDFENIIIVEYELTQMLIKIEKRYNCLNKQSVIQSVSNALAQVHETKNEIIQNYNNQSH
jgi:hypothetical protein